MQQRHGRTRLGIGLTIAALTAAALGGLHASAAPAGGEAGGGGIAIAIGSEPSTLDPQLRDDGGERAINDNIYEPLLFRDAEGELHPHLAAEMPTQVDDTTWEVVIREGITFHNGEELTAETVAASFQRILDPEFNSEQLTFIETIESVEVIDETTVHFTTDGADPILPSRLYWVKVVPAEYSADPAFAEAPVGTGPYRFVEWSRGQEIVLERNPDYWGEVRPTIDRATYRFVAEPGTRTAGLINGEFDLMTNLAPEDTERAPRFAHVQGLEHPVLILNTVDGPTADVNVRRALNLAVDKEALAAELFGGYAQVDDCQILSPAWTGYNENLEPYGYDPDEARRLIEEAGVAGSTIQLVGTAGRWLKDRETIEAIAGFWSEVGLEVDVQIFEFSEYLDRLFDRETRPDAIYVTSSNELLDADRTLTGEYHRDGIEASNDDAEMAGWIDAARVESDPEAREELYAQVTERACSEAYFTFLLNIEDLYGMSDRLDWQPRVDAKLLVAEMSLA